MSDTRMIWLCLLMLVASAAQCRTITVGGKAAVKTLGAALKLARPGDTLLVLPGIYKEKNINVDFPVVIRGKDIPVLDGNSKEEIMTIRAVGVVVEGLEFRHSGKSSYNDIAALRIAETRYVTIRNNRFRNNFFGIFLQHATGCVIEGNELQSDAKDEINSANGIHCWKSDSLIIRNNKVSGHRDGIYFEFVTHSQIIGNKSFGNVRYGLHFMFSNNDVYRFNEFRDNGAGVAVMYSNHISMYHNLFADNWGSAAYGILLKEISDGEVMYNRFLRNSVGILMEGSSRLQMEKNLFDRNGWALKIQANCADNMITRNNFIGNSFDVATNGDLVLSRFEKNYWDKYEGYDLNRNGIGDVPYRPVSLFSMISERNNAVMMMYRSMMSILIDKVEKIIPVLTPVDMKDDSPLMKPVK